MAPSENCYAMIRQYEGCRLTAYPDPATGGAPWTIGYGHTGPEVHMGMSISQHEANDLLVNDANRVAAQVSKLVTVQLSQAEFDALVCFVFNVGIGNFAKSTMLKKLNAEDYVGAAHEFTKWDRAAGKEMPGLLARRVAEEKEFERGIA